VWPESVWETLRNLEPHRIGHGIRSVEDPQLLEHLRQTRRHLEVCPSSNVQLVESIQEWRDHPIDRLRAAGVCMGINTDNRMVNGTTLTREYSCVAEHFGWTEGDFVAANLSAIANAFVDERTRIRLTDRIIAARNLDAASAQAHD
jgi:adenosine deaminase